MTTRNSVVPMNCIDKVLLSYEVGKQRMNFHLILTVEGHIEPSRLNQALLSVLHLHPTMRTTVGSRLGRSLRCMRECCETLLETAEGKSCYEDHLSEWINRPLDPRKELPVRVLLLTKGEDMYSVVFTFHHSAVDGLRAVRFIEEVMARYEGQDLFESALCYGVRCPRNKDELMALAREESRRIVRFHRAMLWYMARFLLTTPFSRSSRIARDGAGQEAAIDFCSGRLDPATLDLVKSGAKSVRATINDLLMATAFRAIDKWNGMCGKDCGKLSLMVPVNLEGEEGQRLTANLVSFISVATNPGDRTDPLDLLRKVNHESALALRQNRGSAFAYIYFSYVLSRLPLPAMRAFARLIKFPIYADTLLHSNLGVITLGQNEDRKGFRIVNFTALGPVVDVMGMFICINTFNGSLGIDLCYKRNCFSKNRAQEFLNLYLGEIENYLKILPPPLDGVTRIQAATVSL